MLREEKRRDEDVDGPKSEIGLDRVCETTNDSRF